MFNDDDSTMYDESGNYNFNQREQRNYTHSYQYFGGWLGQEELEKEKERKKQLGKLDMPVAVPPENAQMRETIEKIAKHVIMKKTAEERRIFEKMIREKNFSNYMFCFLDEPNRPVCGLGAVKTDDLERPVHALAGDKGEQQIAREYYLFLKHAEERQVDYVPLVKRQIMIEKDRAAKMKKAKGEQPTPATSSSTPAASSSASAPGKGPNAGAEKSPTPAAKEPEPATKPESKEPEPEEPLFTDGSRIEIIGLEKRPDLNGQAGSIIKWHTDVGRYEVRMDKFGMIIKAKPANVMYATVQTDTAAKEKNESTKFGEFPKDCKVEIFGLQSEAARWLNGQEGTVVGYDEEAKRYEIKLCRDVNQVKRVKYDNLKLSLPPGWIEHYDEHSQRSYYVESATNKVTWKHPVGMQVKTKFDTVNDANEDLEEAVFDDDPDRYGCDDLEEGEGQFNLDDLVEKVRQREEANVSGEEGDEPTAKRQKTDQAPQTAGAKKKARKARAKQMETYEGLMAKLAEVKKAIEFPAEREEGNTKESIIRIFGELETELELELNSACSEKREADISEKTERIAAEALIIGMMVIGKMLENQPKAKFTFQGLYRCANRVEGLETAGEFLSDIQYLYGLLKTM